MRSETVIDAILIESKSGREANRAGAFIDCSGDADLARWAGAPYEQSNKPGGTYYTSHMFRMSDVNAATAAGDRQLIPKLMAEAESRGEERFPRKGAIVNPIVHKSEWYANATQQKKPDGSALDATNVDDLTYGSSKGGGRSSRSSTSPTRTCRVSSGPTSSIFRHRIGVRETRRIVGRYQLSVDDVMNCTDFPDAIGVNGWPVEAHVAGDVIIRFPTIAEARGFHQLPFRMIVPQGIENLYVAGRCTSMTHEGQCSARVSGPCYVMGQATGTVDGVNFGADVGHRARKRPAARA